MRTVLRWLAGNIPIAVLAFILAAVAWAVAMEEADPVRMDRYVQEIPVTVTGRPEDVYIVGGVNENVMVTVRAPESVWDSLRPGDFEAEVDLSGVGVGVHELPIQVDLSKHPSEVVSWEPQYVTLELQSRVERTVPVEVDTTGQPALAYQALTHVVTPTQVTISGPSSYVDRVTWVGAQLSIQNASVGVEEDLPLQALDAEGQSVPLITLTPDTVRVRVPIELKEDRRPLTVKPVREGLVAYGYTISEVSVTPKEVTVSGAPEIIAALPGTIETEPISVEGAQASVTAHPALNVPPDVVLLPGQQITVTYFVEAIQSSRTIEITPTVQGLAPELTATVSPATVEVFLNGPLAELEALEINDIRVVVDLFELKPGTFQIDPAVVVPDVVTGFSIQPTVIQVKISIAPTPALVPPPTLTPTPTPRPTPSPTAESSGAPPPSP